MIYRNVIAATIALTVCVVGSSNAAAQRHGGFGGASFGHSSFRGSGSARMTSGFTGAGSRFRPELSRDFRGEHGGFRHHRRFNDSFFFDDFDDPFFYPFGYYGYYPANSYDSYDYGRDANQVDGGYTGSLVEEVQLRLAEAGYYHAAIDGVSGNATRAAIRQYQRAHRLTADGQIRGPLLATMRLR